MELNWSTPDELAEYIRERVSSGDPLSPPEKQSLELYAKMRGWLAKLGQVEAGSEKDDETAIKQRIESARKKAKELGNALRDNEMGKWGGA